MADPSKATPLDIMLEACHQAYVAGGAFAAFPYAEKTAPYFHPKRVAVEGNPDKPLMVMAAVIPAKDIQR